ncbi:MAG: hypothetical protein PHH71_00030 [Clostridia bacterium]|jgi:hypothetical protein|nr:hypothetical protein [Clostridia bacterium]MDD3231758.1 hypothetical protein [Clostridia bacterium]MDD3862442.1 hypothetical protein [Clostridia bacterium]MDD4408596.1 hypothetical protein [Clostridia bacterium]
MENNETQIKNALIKKAIGYNTKETAEEYAISDGDEILSKKKISIKHFPPDVSAIKLFLLYYGEKSAEMLNELSDEDLETEKIRLLKSLKDEPTKEQNDLLKELKKT